MRLTVMALAMVLTTGIANAQQPEVLMGFGSATCGEFAHATELEGDYFAWAQGFMSGWNWGNVSKSNWINYISRYDRVVCTGTKGLRT